MTDQTEPAPGSDAPAPEPSAGRPLDRVPDDWRRVSPKYLAVDLGSGIVWALIVVAAASMPVVFAGAHVPWLLVLPIALAVVFIISLALTPRRVRSIGYRLRDDDLLFRRGILFRRVVAVPYGRMQLVDITRGPLERRFGLSSLKLVTAAAASNVAIPGLAEADADELRDRLVELAETRRAGL